MLRKIAILAVLVVVIAAAFASAATLGVSGGAIQYGLDQTLYCDLDGVFVLGWGLETDTDTVSFVRIGGIDGACYSNDMFVAVLDGGGSVIASGSVAPIDNGTEIIYFDDPLPSAEAIETLRVWIEGPAAP